MVFQRKIPSMLEDIFASGGDNFVEVYRSLSVFNRHRLDMTLIKKSGSEKIVRFRSLVQELIEGKEISIYIDPKTIKSFQLSSDTKEIETEVQELPKAIEEVAKVEEIETEVQELPKAIEEVAEVEELVTGEVETGEDEVESVEEVVEDEKPQTAPKIQLSKKKKK